MSIAWLLVRRSAVKISPLAKALYFYGQGRQSAKPSRPKASVSMLVPWCAGFFYGEFMAGDWIKMRTSLLTHPKVVRMSSAFGADRIRTVGGIYAVWCLFDMHSEDGQLEGYTADALDGLVGLTGISAAMASVGWLEITDHGISTPEFDTHNGQSAKRRATESERKRNDRKMSATDADKNGTDCGLEKRREEKKREEIVNKEIQAPEGVSAQVWQDFKKSRKTMRAAITQSAIDGIQREANKAGWTMEAALMECCARGWRGFKAEWVADKPTQGAKPSGKHTGFSQLNYREGINEDGTLA